MDRLIQIGLSNALLAAIPAVLALVVGRVWKRPAVAHALWLLALVKLVTPPIVMVPVAVLPAAQPAREPAPWVEEFAAAGSGMGVSPMQSAEVHGRDAHATWRISDLPWGLMLAYVWASGVAVCLVLNAWRIVRFRRLLRCAERAPKCVEAQTQQMAGHLGLKRWPGVWMVEGAVSPMLWGLGRARLLLPRELWGRLSAQQQEALLAHELAHYRRGDHWVRWLELVVGVVYWWHPVVWWGGRALREAEEQCCDAWVVWAMPGNAKEYATALVETVDFLSEDGTTAPALASGIGHVQGLMRRLTMIMRASTPRALSNGARILVLALGLLLLPMVPKLAAGEEKDKPSPAKESDVQPAKEGEKDRDVKREGDKERESKDRVEKKREAGEGEGKDRIEKKREAGEGEGKDRIEKKREAGEGEGKDRVEKKREAGEREDKDRVEKKREADRPDADKRDGERREGDKVRDGEKRDGEKREGDKVREGERPREKDAKAPVRPRQIKATVIRTEGENLVIAVGDARREVVVPVEKDTQITLNEKPAKLEDLKQDYFVTITQAEGLTRTIDARSPRVRTERKDGEVKRGEK